MAERDEELQHGSTVLPGAPMPWFARPHDAAPAEPEPDPVDAQPESEPPGEAPVAEEPAADEQPPAGTTVEAAASAAPVHGRHRAPEPEAAPSSRRLLLLVGALVVVVLLALVALFVWPGLLTSSDSDAGAAPAPPASATAPSPSPSPTPTVALVVPASLAGLTKLSGAADKALTAAVSGTTVAGLTSPVSAVYGRKDVASAQVIAWKATAPPAQDSVDAAFTGFEGSGSKVTAVRPLQTGTLGGRMSCGETTVAKTPSLLCFWADEVSFGSITLLSPKDRAKAEKTALAIRAGVERKG